jgi:MFS family permease
LGSFASIHHPAGLSLIARRVTENKGKALGIHGVLGNVGLFLTPLFAALCVMLFDSWRSAYIIYGVIGLCFALLLYFSRIQDEEDLAFSSLVRLAKAKNSVKNEPEPLAVEAGGDGSLARITRGDVFYVVPIALLFLFLGSGLSGFIFRGSLTYFPALFKEEILFVANHDEPVVMAGFLTTAVLSLGLIGAWFGGWINDKLERPEFIPAIIFVGVTPLLFLISRFSDHKLILVSALFSLIYYAWQPAQNYLIAKYTKKSSHGMGFGVNFFLIFGVGSIATATGGYVADDFGVDLFYRIMAMVSLAAICASLVVFLVRKTQLRIFWRIEKGKEAVQ